MGGIRGNNYTEIKELRAIQDEIMDAIAAANEILARSLPIEESRLLWRAINEKQEAAREKVRACLKQLARCIVLLDELEEKEDLLHAECYALLERDRESAGSIQRHGVDANRRLDSWVRRNLQILKRSFSRKEVLG
jgi:hypothetical protein